MSWALHNTVLWPCVAQPVTFLHPNQHKCKHWMNPSAILDRRLMRANGSGTWRYEGSRNWKRANWASWITCTEHARTDAECSGTISLKLMRDIAIYIETSFFNTESEEGTEPSSLLPAMDLVIHRHRAWQQHPQAVGNIRKVRDWPQLLELCWCDQ